MDIERRQFHRVRVQLQWEWSLVTLEEKEEEIQRLKTQAYAPIDPYISWQQLAVQFDDKYQSLTKEESVLGDLLRILSEQNKIISDLYLHPSPESLAVKKLETLDLSAGGLGMLTKLPVVIGQAVKGRLLLLPLYNQVAFIGNIVSCTPEVENNFRVGIAFDYLPAQDLEYLQRYLIRMERQQRRLKQQS